MAWLKAICNHGPGRQGVSVDWRYAPKATKLAIEEFTRETREQYEQWDQPAIVRVKVFRGLPLTVHKNMIDKYTARMQSAKGMLKLLDMTPVLPDPKPVRCMSCKGKGTRTFKNPNEKEFSMRCVMCQGTGKVRRKEDY